MKAAWRDANKAALAALMLALAGCMAEPRGKTIEEMSPAEVEAAVKVLESACRAAGISTGSRDWDDCVKAEAIKRGYTR